ncbi:hypothetical protein ACFX14_002664 [Malus domestica]
MEGSFHQMVGGCYLALLQFAIKGINSKVQASRAIVDYHSLLAPAGRYKVTATAPGYKSKTTCIWLEAGTTNGDFVLDPEVNPRVIQLQSACDCSWGSMSIIST